MKRNFLLVIVFFSWFFIAASEARAVTTAAFQATQFALQMRAIHDSQDLQNLALYGNKKFEKEIKAEFADGRYKAFIPPVISMPSETKVEFKFPEATYVVSFDEIDKNQIRFQNLEIKLEKQKNFFNYRSEVQKVLRKTQTSSYFVLIPEAIAAPEGGKSMIGTIGSYFGYALDWLGNTQASKDFGDWLWSDVKLTPEAQVQSDASDAEIGAAATSPRLAIDILHYFEFQQAYECTYYEKNCNKLGHAFFCKDGRLQEIGEWDAKTGRFTDSGWHLRTTTDGKGYAYTCDGKAIANVTNDFAFVDRSAAAPDTKLCKGYASEPAKRKLSRNSALHGLPETFQACCAKKSCYNTVSTAQAAFARRAMATKSGGGAVSGRAN